MCCLVQIHLADHEEATVNEIVQFAALRNAWVDPGGVYKVPGHPPYFGRIVFIKG